MRLTLFSRTLAIASSLALALLVPACGRSPEPMPDLPPGTQPLPATGTHEVRTDLMVADMYARYGGAFRGFEVRSFLPATNAGWGAVDAHFERALQGWDADPRFGPRMGRHHARTWVQDGRVVVAELFDADGTAVLLVGSNAWDAE